MILTMNMKLETVVDGNNGTDVNSNFTLNVKSKSSINLIKKTLHELL